MQAYILNTGSIGAKDGSPGEKITIRVSTDIMKEIAREGIAWEKDPDWGYEVPAKRARAWTSPRYGPRGHYTRAEYAGLVDKLREERRAWLAYFPGLDPVIPKAVAKAS